MNLALTFCASLPFLALACSASAPPAPPNEARYRADLAAVHLNYGRADAAIALYREAVDLESVPAEKALYLQGLSQAHGAAKSEAAAREALEKALSIYEALIRESPQGAVQFLERYVRLAERARAKRLVDEVVARHAAQSDPQALVWLANVYLAMESAAEALRLYEQAEAKTADPLKRGQLLLSQALLLTRLKSFDKAEAVYKALIREGPPEVSQAASKNLLMLYAAQGRTDKVKLIDP